MEITRKILGQKIEDDIGQSIKIEPVEIKIELTDEELTIAYQIKQHEYDIEDLENELDCRDYEGIPAIYMDGMAKEYRELLDKGWADHLAIDEIIDRHKNLLSEYEMDKED